MADVLKEKKLPVVRGADDESIFRSLALYGSKGAFKPPAFLAGAGELFFELIGSGIDAVQIEGKRMPAEPISIEEAKKIMGQRAAQVEAVALYQSRENPQSYLFGWLAQASLDAVSGQMIFSCPRELFPPDFKRLLYQEELVSPFFYGTIYDLPFNRGPAIFAAGALTEAWPEDTPEAIAEQKRVSEWMYEFPRAIAGVLRDVFPINLLTALHFQKQSNGDCVADIIRREGLGPLPEICPGVYEWKPKDVQVARNILMKHDLIICK